MYQSTPDTTNYNYQLQYFSTVNTSVEEMNNTSAIVDNIATMLVQKPFKPLSYHGLIPFFKSDASSVFYDFEIKNETFSETNLKGQFPFEMLEHDAMVHIPAQTKYSIQLNITSIKKGEPGIVEPEDFF